MVCSNALTPLFLLGQMWQQLWWEGAYQHVQPACRMGSLLLLLLHFSPYYFYFIKASYSESLLAFPECFQGRAAGKIPKKIPKNLLSAVLSGFHADSKKHFGCSPWSIWRSTVGFGGTGAVAAPADTIVALISVLIIALRALGTWQHVSCPAHQGNALQKQSCPWKISSDLEMSPLDQSRDLSAWLALHPCF